MTIRPAPRDLTPIGRGEMLILVDERNRRVGVGDKLEVHRTGRLHRAFSIFLADAHGRVLLQQRASTKYHSGGLWANTCCGHPRLGERTIAAAHRRLGEELGLSAALRPAFRARYRAALDQGLIENELVYVYVGALEAAPKPNPDEVSDTRLVSLATLATEADAHPGRYAYWLRHYLTHHRTELERGLAALAGG